MEEEDTNWHSSLPQSFGWQPREKTEKFHKPPSRQFQRSDTQENYQKRDFRLENVAQRYVRPSMWEDPWKDLQEGKVKVGLDGIDMKTIHNQPENANRTPIGNRRPVQRESEPILEEVQDVKLVNPDEIDLDSD